MKLIIDIDKKDYNSIISDKLISPRNLNVYERIIANGIPLSEELENILAEDAELSEQSGFVSVAELISKCIEKLKGE